MTLEQNADNLKKLAGDLVGIVQNQEAEVRLASGKKQKMDEEMERKKREMKELEMEKLQMDAEIMCLRLRDKAYQKEQTNLRNAITVTKFQIEKIKETIEKTKRSELEELKEFERAVDEITEKFRGSPAIYDRRNLSERLEEERERRKSLVRKIQEAREAYESFNKAKGLRERSRDDEELMDCILPGSELHRMMEMTNNLEEVTNEMKKYMESIAEKESEFERLEGSVSSATAKVAAYGGKPKKETEEPDP